MKLVELKCKNCGANLKVEEGVTQVKCDFCNTTFSVDDAYTEGYKYTKGVYKAQEEHAERAFAKMNEFMKNSPTAKISKVIFVIASIIIVAIFGFIIYNIIQFETGTSSFDVTSFNSSYEVHAGKTSGFFLTGVLDDIVTSNKTNRSHIITVKYKDKSTTNEKEIKDIRNSIDSRKDYDLSFDYDSKGFINCMTIEDIE